LKLQTAIERTLRARPIGLVLPIDAYLRGDGVMRQEACVHSGWRIISLPSPVGARTVNSIRVEIMGFAIPSGLDYSGYCRADQTLLRGCFSCGGVSPVEPTLAAEIAERKKAERTLRVVNRPSQIARLPHCEMSRLFPMS
jgi:two-component system C4-dicarboxylate transport sensor histidine kinase DctB